MSIDVVADDGQPLKPEDICRKYVTQCGVLVRDTITITIAEWNKPKKANDGASYVEQRIKDLLWDTLLTHFSLPQGLPEKKKAKVKEWALKKMATQFQTWKKKLWKTYVAAEEQDPEFTGSLVKIQEHWPTFVKQRKSEAAVARSKTNKLNAGKKVYHHTLGAGGYKAAVPKWEAFEAKLLDNGVIPQTADWPERSKFWLFAHGAGLDPVTGLIVAQEKWKEKLSI